MSVLTRRPRSLALIGGLSAALMVASITPAQAATPSFISVSAAYAALPAAKLLPGAVRLEEKILVPGQSEVFACLLSEQPLTFKATMVGEQLVPAHHQTPEDKTAGWQVVAVVFHNAKLAKAAQAKVLQAEKSCPRSLPDSQGSGSGFSYHRAVSKTYSVNGWKGYRTVDTIEGLDLLNGPAPVGVRVNNVILTRGNVMLNILEQGPVDPGTAARQASYATIASKTTVKLFNAIG